MSDTRSSPDIVALLVARDLDDRVLHDAPGDTETVYIKLSGSEFRRLHSLAQPTTIPLEAIVNLVNYQTQRDEDGVMVQVSRQALAEVLLYVTAVALNRQADDEKHGVFDLQAQHDRDMLERLGQVERLKKDRDEWRQKVWDAEAKASSIPSTEHK